jgi:prevent-host-death family protein
MDFVTVRELRAESAKVWAKIEAGEEVVITRNGKPFALLLNTKPEELESTVAGGARPAFRSHPAQDASACRTAGLERHDHGGNRRRNRPGTQGEA